MADGRTKLTALVGMVLILAALLQWTPPGHAQSFSSPIQENDRIVPGDAIEVHVEDAPELSKTYGVNASGTFLMRFLGTITAQHRTEKELAGVIAHGLKGRYLKAPKVSVRIIRPSRAFKNLLGAIDHYYFIQGAVRNPGAYQIQGEASLLGLIALAGGLTETHGPLAYILRDRSNKGTGRDRRDNSSPEYETTTVDIDSVLKGTIRKDVTLQRGDVVNIPVADIFVVTGEVNAPGSFPFKQGVTLREAVVLARGLTVNAVVRQGVIFREDPTTGQRTEIKVDIAAITSGKSKDVVIQPNDIIVVPSSRARTVHRFRLLDSPPVPHFKPCPRSGPCIARLSWTEQRRIRQQDCLFVSAVAADGSATCDFSVTPTEAGLHTSSL